MHSQPPTLASRRNARVFWVACVQVGATRQHASGLSLTCRASTTACRTRPPPGHAARSCARRCYKTAPDRRFSGLLALFKAGSTAAGALHEDHEGPRVAAIYFDVTSIIGLVIVIGCVIGGYLMHHGNLAVLNQPHEFIIIFGSAGGALVASTPMKIIKDLITQLKGLLGARPGKKEYLELLTLQYELFQVAQKSGLLGWEEHVNDPSKSSIFKKYPAFLANHHAVHFMTDTMKVIVSGAAEPHDLEALMDADLESLHAEEAKAPAALSAISDALPGLGIVAAVLGIVITMGHIDGPPAEIGMNVASALVGTFLGILMSYGVLGPLSAAITHRNGEFHKYIETIKFGILAHAKGVAPSIAVEFARRSVSEHERPTFEELEQACRAAKG